MAPTPCTAERDNVNFDISECGENDPAGSNGTSSIAIIGSVLGSLIVLILIVILALQLTRSLRRKRRHIHTLQGTMHMTLYNNCYHTIILYYNN